MTGRVFSIGPDEPAEVAWSRMQRERIRHLVVLDRGRLVGILSERDLGGREGAALRRGRLVGELMDRYSLCACAEVHGGARLAVADMKRTG